MTKKKTLEEIEEEYLDEITKTQIIQFGSKKYKLDDSKDAHK